MVKGLFKKMKSATKVLPAAHLCLTPNEGDDNGVLIAAVAFIGQTQGGEPTSYCLRLDRLLHTLINCAAARFSRLMWGRTLPTTRQYSEEAVKRVRIS